MVDTTSQLVLRKDDARGVTTLTLNRDCIKYHGM